MEGGYQPLQADPKTAYLWAPDGKGRYLQGVKSRHWPWASSHPPQKAGFFQTSTFCCAEEKHFLFRKINKYTQVKRTILIIRLVWLKWDVDTAAVSSLNFLQKQKLYLFMIPLPSPNCRCAGLSHLVKYRWFSQVVPELTMSCESGPCHIDTGA